MEIKQLNLIEQLTHSCLGICKEGFDIVSCQFAMHYFFKNNQTLGDFVQKTV